ncbi:MAG TPA: peptide ABC transporter substrate-binding protein [Dehalococcoidia bacterium]|nr:peptide ABC transporter substrate-binding protein [Dehalococcoidia bacterium]
MRVHWPLVLVAALLLLAVSVWVATGNPLQNGGGKGERYSEAIMGSPFYVNPLLSSFNDVDRDLSSLVFSGLTRLNTRGEAQPDLAESWEISPDGLTYRFKLRPGVKWHSGMPFTADDVVFTYSLLGLPAFPGDPALNRFWSDVKCEKVEELVVKCILPDPFAGFLTQATIGILPRYAFEGMEADRLTSASFNSSPDGTGPYRLVELTDSRALLRSNQNYHLGKPQIDEIELRFYQDAEAAMTAYFSKEVMGLVVGTNVSQEDLESLTTQRGVKVYTANRTAYTALYLNNIQPPFTDPRVRQAVAYGINKDAIISGFLSGRAVRADSPIPPGTWASTNDLKTYNFDPAKARSLLDEAGWTTDGRSVRRKGDERLEFALITDSDPLRRAIAQEIARELLDIHVGVTVFPLGSTDLVRDFLLPLQYQAAIFGFDPGYDPDPYPAWHSSQTLLHGLNLAGYVSNTNDKILEEARETTDQERRRNLYIQFQKNFAEDGTSVLLYYPVYTYVLDKSLRNVQIGTLFDLSSRFYNIHQWTIDKGVPIE